MIELCRSVQHEQVSLVDMVLYLERLITDDEKYDGISKALKPTAPVVRLMNLHKVKGLEAPVVFLADPTGNYEHPIGLHIDRSGDRVRGYMAVYGPRPETGFSQPRLIACPVEWARFEEAERDFLEAENERLLYVAATRSGTCLVVSGRDKRPGDNPWRSLVEDLAAGKQHEDPGPQPAPSRGKVNVDLAQVEDAVSEINKRWSVVRKDTYRVEAVKAAALAGTSSGADLQPGGAAVGAKPVDVEPAEPTRQAERGVAWGQDMHKLLDVAMRRRDRDLLSLARSLAQEGELEEHDEDWVQQLVKTAHQVRQSEIWKRALASKRVFAEIPFSMLAKSDDAAATPGVQTLRRGAIDLAFFEGSGWVIVDYKTDRVTESSVSDKVEYYRPQVQGYAEAWASLVQEPVIESGLYFTSLDRYRRL